ncbi:MAG: hypothetical protein E7310_00095 [Clostridiales bacterium]|nr:hypothetical protein [Clostridiales bacterium]
MSKQSCESQNPPETPSVPEFPGTYLAHHEKYGWCLHVMAGAGTRQEVKDILKEYCSKPNQEGELDEVGKTMQEYITIYKVHKF